MQAVGYQLGVVEVLRTGHESDTVGYLGPDLLGPDWDAAEAVRRLTADPGRAIGEAILDQHNLAGIGNIYKTETLFLRGVSPWRPVGQVDELAELVELARRLLEANKERHRPGHHCRHPAWRGRTGSTDGPADRAGAAAPQSRQANQGPDLAERITFWCPRCQPD